MAQTDSGPVTFVRVTVRFFAAARAAAGVDETELRLDRATGTTDTTDTTDTELVGGTVDDAVTALGVGNPALARVLERCSFLVDEVAVRDRHVPLRDGATMDVLPPFAGG